MTVNLIKLCVGVSDVTQLIQEHERLVKQALKRKTKKPVEDHHWTRMRPKRDEEVLDGGSLYWVIRGQVSCRQRLTAVRPFVDREGVGRCRLVLEPALVLVEPRPFRAFQGWRYLAEKDAPRDLDRAAPGVAAMPEDLRRELRQLGLL